MNAFFSENKKVEFLIVCLVALLVFYENTYYAFRFFELGVFHQFNVIFDTDPVSWYQYFSTTGTNGDQRHLLLGQFVPIPLFALGKAIGALSGSFSSKEVQGLLAILVTPLASGLIFLFLFYTFRLVAFCFLSACFASLIITQSFNISIFAHVPNSYIFTALSYSAILFYSSFLTRKIQNEATLTWVNYLIFYILGIISIGITSTNGMFVFIALFFLINQLVKNKIPALFISGFASLFTLISAITLSQVLDLLKGGSRPWSFLLEDTGFISKFAPTVEQQIGKITSLPLTVYQSIFAAIPETDKNTLPLENDKFDYLFTYLNTSPLTEAGFYIGLLVLGALVYALYDAKRSQDRANPILFLCLSSCAFYLAFYSLFGIHTYLYSLHWSIQIWLVFLLLLNKIIKNPKAKILTLASLLILSQAGASYITGHMHDFLNQNTDLYTNSTS